MTMRTARTEPSFAVVFACVRAMGGADAVSTRGTRYRITATVSRGREVLIARPRSGEVRIHQDCWGQDLTCQGTRAGGVINGSPSIYDWYEAHC